MGSLKSRTISGVLFLVAMIAAMLHPWTYLIVFSFSIVVMTIEYYRMAIGNSYHIERIISIVGCLLLFILMFLSRGMGYFDTKYLLCAIIPILATFALLLYENKEKLMKDNNIVFHLFIPYIYIALPMTMTVFLTFPENGIFDFSLLLSVFLIIWLNDVGAYVFGMSFGQSKNSKKLFPSISPNKSWVGFWGGFFIALVSAMILWGFRLLDLPLVYSILIAVVTSVFGVYGDLFESLIKRHYGVKDAGKIMPGHGGLLDRFDGALFALPAVVVFLVICGLI